MAIKTVNSGADEPYGFDEPFERAVTYLACSDEKFWSMVGYAIDPALLSSQNAKLLFTAAGAVARDTGRSPASALIVIQRLRRWMREGRYTQDDVFGCNDYLDDALAAGIPNVQVAIGEIVPILRRRAEIEAIETGLKELQGGNNLSRINTALERAASIGRVNEDLGTTWGAQTAARTVRERSIEKLSTYIPELDDAFVGGFGRGTMTALLGGSGAGKSLGLTHFAVAGSVQGLNVAVATLEIPTVQWSARVHSCACGVETNEVIHSLPEHVIAKQVQDFTERCDNYYGYPPGRVVIRDFPAKATSPRDIITWVERIERESNSRFDMIIVDYADKLKPSGGQKKSNSESASSYTAMGDIYDEFFTYGKDTRRWTLTATQAKGHKEGEKTLLDENDCADSINKTRTLDQLISLNPRDEFASLLWYIAKARYSGCRGYKIGPLPHAFSIGRIAPVVWCP